MAALARLALEMKIAVPLNAEQNKLITLGLVDPEAPETVPPSRCKAAPPPPSFAESSGLPSGKFEVSGSCGVRGVWGKW